MSFEIRPAKRERTALLVGIHGPSWSGKTRSSLRLASGLAPGGKIILADTENGRALHHADDFAFDHMPFEPPFSSERYMEAAIFAKERGADVFIIDSASHEHESEGGVLDRQEQELQRLTERRPQMREKMGPVAWNLAKQPHKKYVNKLLQLNMNIIMCMRAQEKLKTVTVKKDGKERTEFINDGYHPIITKGFEFEMAVLLFLPPGAAGVPDLDPKYSKVPGFLSDAFPAGVQISEEMGASLSRWAQGGVSGQGRTDQPAEPKAAQTPAQAPSELVTQEQADELEALAAEVKADEAKFFAHFSVKGYGDFTVSGYELAKRQLERKRT